MLEANRSSTDDSEIESLAQDVIQNRWSKLVAASGSSAQSSKTSLRKITVWDDDTPGGDEPTLTDCGHLTESDDGTVTVKLTQSQLADTDVPTNPEGWQILVTTEHDDHTEGKIDGVKHTHASVQWSVTPDPVTFTQLNP